MSKTIVAFLLSVLALGILAGTASATPHRDDSVQSVRTSDDDDGEATPRHHRHYVRHARAERETAVHHRYRHRHVAHVARAERNDEDARPVRRHAVRHARAESGGDYDSGHYNAGPRPSQWCGWYMRTRHGGGPEYNVAANWRHYGSPSSPQVGAIVVWPHHVGEIVGRANDGRWIVLSGNWSGRVQAVPRSISGASVRM